MPTFSRTERFRSDYAGLTATERAMFRTAVAKFIADLPSRRFRPSLRVRGVQGAVGVFELTWADNGRATFEYGRAVREGETHVVWRRVGTHEILSRP